MKRYEIYYQGQNIYQDGRSYTDKYYAQNKLSNLYEASTAKFSDFELKEVNVDEGVILTNRQKEIIRNSMEYELDIAYGSFEEEIEKEMREILELLK